MTDDRLVGTWRLQTWQARDLDGGLLVEPFGPRPQGLLTYTADGVVHGQMMRPDRPAFSRPRSQAVDFASGSPDELATAFNSYVAYAGTYDVDPEQGRVWHRVEIALIPGWEGIELERSYSLEDDTLTLRTPVRAVGGVPQIGVLVWRRR